MKYGYVRCSTEKQDFIRQEHILKSYNVDRIFEEKISGTKQAKTRPEFENLINVLQEGDTIYFESMSRLARSVQDLIDTTNALVNHHKVKVVFIKENISIGGKGLDAMGALVFNIMGAFAQFERDLIADRTKQALMAKKERGVVLGAPRRYDREAETVKSLRAKGWTIADIASETGISPATVSRMLKR